MSDPIDVLAVMDKCMDMINPHVSPEHGVWNRQLSQARDAVANLIEAAKDCNEWLCRTGREGSAHQRHLLAALDRLGVSADRRLRGEA